MGHPKFRGRSIQRLAFVVAVVVVGVVVLVVPVAFVHLPALLVVVVVGMAPGGSPVRRTLPDAAVPDVAASIVTPVAFGPDKAHARRGSPDFVAERWRRTANVDVDRGGGGGCGKGGKDKTAGDHIEFPVRAIEQEGLHSGYSRLDANAEWKEKQAQEREMRGFFPFDYAQGQNGNKKKKTNKEILASPV